MPVVMKPECADGNVNRFVKFVQRGALREHIIYGATATALCVSERLATA